MKGGKIKNGAAVYVGSSLTVYNTSFSVGKS